MRSTHSSELLRMRVRGPGLPGMLGGEESAGEWLFSLRGRFYLWHPPGLLWLGSASLFAPTIARGTVLLTSTECLAAQDRWRSHSISRRREASTCLPLTRSSSTLTAAARTLRRRCRALVFARRQALRRQSV